MPKGYLLGGCRIDSPREFDLISESVRIRVNGLSSPEKQDNFEYFSILHCIKTIQRKPDTGPKRTQSIEQFVVPALPPPPPPGVLKARKPPLCSVHCVQGFWWFRSPYVKVCHIEICSSILKERQYKPETHLLALQITGREC